MLGVDGEFEGEFECFVVGELEWFGQLKNGGLIFADASDVDGPAAIVWVAIDGRSDREVSFVLLVGGVGGGELDLLFF